MSKQAYAAKLREMMGNAFQPAQEVPRLGERDYRQVLRDQIREESIARVERGEEQFLDQKFIEDQLGARVVDAEIPGFFFQNQLAAREELDRAVNYVQQSGRLPEGSRVVGAQNREGGFEVLYQPPGEEDFYRVNKQGPSLGDVGKYSPNPFSLETWGAIAAELAGPKGLGRAGRYALDAIAAGLGRGADELLEDVTVGDKIDPERLRDRAIESGFVGAIGRGVGEAGEAFANLATGRGLRLGGTGRPEVDYAAEALSISERRGLPPLSAGDLAVSPILGRAERQAQALVPREQRRGIDRLNAYYQEVYNAADFVERPTEISDAALSSIVSGEKKRLERQLRRNLRQQGLDLREQTTELGGRAVGEAIQGYKSATGERGRRLYDNAFRIAEEDGVTFDISRTKQAVQEELEPLVLDALQKQQNISDRIQAVIANPDAASPEELKLVKEFIANDPETGEVMIPRDYGAALNNVFGALQEADAAQGPQRVEALRKLGTYLRELGEPSSGIARTPAEARAVRVLGELNQDLQESGSGRFVEAITEANNLWKERSSVLGSFNFVDKLDEIGGGERIYRALMNNPTEEGFRQAMGLMGAKRKLEFQAAFLNDMISNPANIGRQLDALGPGVRNQLLPESTQDVLRIYERQIGAINSDVISQAIGKEERATGLMRSIIQRGDKQAINQSIRQARMSPEEVRRNIVMSFLDETSSTKGGTLVLNPASYERVLKTYEDKGLLSYLTPEQRSTIKDVNTLTSFLRNSSDAGSSIASAEIASQQVGALNNPGNAISARLKQVYLSLAARLANNPAYLKATIGVSKPEDYTKTRAALLGITTAIDDVFGEVKPRQVEDPEPPL